MFRPKYYMGTSSQHQAPTSLPQGKIFYPLDRALSWHQSSGQAKTYSISGIKLRFHYHRAHSLPTILNELSQLPIWQLLSVFIVCKILSLPQRNVISSPRIAFSSITLKCQLPWQFEYGCFEVVTMGITTGIIQLYFNYIYRIVEMKTIHISVNSGITLIISITTYLQLFCFLACLYMSIWTSLWICFPFIGRTIILSSSLGYVNIRQIHLCRKYLGEWK
jgi:hypothetical protein